MSRPPTPLLKRFLAKVRIPDNPDACWPWLASSHAFGYGRIYCHEERRLISAHVAAYLLFIGPIPVGLQVNHTCDTPACSNPRHLYTGTQLDNIEDMRSRGRVRNSGITSHLAPHQFTSEGTRGERNRAAKLREADFPLILGLRHVGWSYRAIAERFHVSRGTIAHIFQGRNWTHLVPPG